jgi:hypothetical protein
MSPISDVANKACHYFFFFKQKKFKCFLGFENWVTWFICHVTTRAPLNDAQTHRPCWYEELRDLRMTLTGMRTSLATKATVGPTVASSTCRSNRFAGSSTSGLVVFLICVGLLATDTRHRHLLPRSSSSPNRATTPTIDRITEPEEY